jgi:hypothetical protein
MPQLISAVRKFAKIDAYEFFGSLRGGGTGAVYSPGVPPVSRSADKAGRVVSGDSDRRQEFPHPPGAEVTARANIPTAESARTAISLNADADARARTAQSNAAAT